MKYSTLISVEQLAAHVNDPDWAIIDCRFSLEEPGLGRNNYLEAHIPGAVYAHLDEDLCSPIIKGVTGRHPLPTIENIVERLSNWGIDDFVQVVVYDDAGGAMAASRLWWLLQWLGHEAVAVLNGGWSKWLKWKYSVTSGAESRAARQFTPQVQSMRLIETREIRDRLHDPALKIIDSRAAERYRGEIEPIDPIAGHIPGALLSPHPNVLDSEGNFLPADELNQHFKSLLGDASAKETAFYCGSGVTAVQNVLAMKYAGMGDARLYAGSWSEWITDPDRPISTGDSP